MRYSALYCGLLLGVYGNAVTATPFVAKDSRSMAMGGTGVASAGASHAPFYNPALIATKQDTKYFSLEVPVTMRATDPDDLLTAATDFGDRQYVANFANSVDAYSAAIKSVQDTLNLSQIPTVTQLQAVLDAQQDMANTSGALTSGVKTLSNKVVTIDANANLALVIPNKTIGLAFVGGVWVSGGVVGEFTQADETFINGLIDVMNNISVDVGAGTISDPTSYTPPTFTADNLSSNFQVRAALVREYGLNLAQERSLFGTTMSIGLTPKFMQISTVDFKLSGQDLNNPDVLKTQGQKDYNAVNVDLGIAREYGDNWKTGFVVKNLVPASFKTTLNNEIKISPAARIGGAYHNNWTTVALDFDLTENEPAGFGDKSRYLALGGEFDLWLLKLRAGYQYNIANARTSMATAGLGLNLFGLHADVAAGIGQGGKGALNAAAQVGFTW